MKNKLKQEELEHDFVDKLLYQIEQKTLNSRRTFGFEYEFISSKALDLGLMDEIYGFLPECGFIQQPDRFRHDSGMYITFEPGGQIEYHSLPLLAEEVDNFDRSMELIEDTNSKIYLELGIKYLPTGYISGRENSPLCLKAERYRKLHSRMPISGSRGLEMMKGTASIHLHVGIQDLEELPLLFSRLNEIGRMEEFRMLKERRDIWDNTDPGRCGMPYRDIYPDRTPRHIVEELVRVAFRADDIGENIPFHETKDLSFEAFMYHMTTMFTDIRLNIKGPSVELRTLDSAPAPQFREKWKRFISLVG